MPVLELIPKTLHKELFEEISNDPDFVNFQKEKDKENLEAARKKQQTEVSDIMKDYLKDKKKNND